jgi:hypothetical protein
MPLFIRTQAHPAVEDEKMNTMAKHMTVVLEVPELLEPARSPDVLP